MQRFGESWGNSIVARAHLYFLTFHNISIMQLRFSFFLLLALLLVVGCNRDDIDVPTRTPGELPPTDSLTVTTSLAGTVKKPDGTIPDNAVAEILYGDFVIHSQQVNSGDGSWFFDDILVSDDPNVLVRISAPGWVPSIRALPNSVDIVHYSNIVLFDRGRTDFVTSSADYTETNGLLTVTIPANSYADHEDDQGVEISLNSYVGDDINSLNNAIAAPFLVNDGGIIKILSNPIIYAVVVTGGNGELLTFDDSQGRDIELSTINASPTSIIYVLNQKTGFWENISTPDGLIPVNQFGYFAVAQVSNSVRITGRIEQPDGTGIPGSNVTAFVTDVNGLNAFDITATDGNGDYELQLPVGSSGSVFLNPQACGQQRYLIEQPTADLDFGIFTVALGTSGLIQGIVEGCVAGVGTSEDIAVELFSTLTGQELIPLDPDGSFSITRDLCSNVDLTLVPIVQSGPSAGRRGRQLTVSGGDPLDNLTLAYCDTVVNNELIFLAIFQEPVVFSTTPEATRIHPDTIEVIGLTTGFPQGELRWKVALGSSKVLATYSDPEKFYTTGIYQDVIDFAYDGIELSFTFEDVPGTQTILSSGSTSVLDANGGVVVKVD